jgi:DNA replication ATP-dependent helicase Dna2
MEEQDLVRFKKELWTMRAEERERYGRCFSNMILDSSYRPPSTTPQATLKKEGKIHQYTYRFMRSSRHPTQTGNNSLLNGQMNTGDAVTVSVEPDLLAFVRGYILDLTPEEVVLGVDHELDIDGIRVRRPKLPKDGAIIFRIDRDELFGGMGRIRDNLAQLFYADGDAKRLSLVVDLKAPRFSEAEEPLLPRHERVKDVIDKLNANQQMAIKKVLTAEDYALVLGMPGTGKTTVITATIRALVAMGKSVLLTSYTHSAVDNILSKLKDDADFGILRLGNLDKVGMVNSGVRVSQAHDQHRFIQTFTNLL